MIEQSPGELYAAYRDKVLGYLMGRTDSRQDAEDLCAAVFEKVYRALPGFDGTDAALAAWVYRITRNTLTDYYRTRRLHESLPEDMETGEDMEDRFIAEESLNRLAEALAALPQAERDVIVLKYYKGYPLTDVARLTRQSYGKVKATHKKALAALRRKLT